jgi:hypothetical protein
VIAQVSAVLMSTLEQVFAPALVSLLLCASRTSRPVMFCRRCSSPAPADSIPALLHCTTGLALYAAPSTSISIKHLQVESIQPPYGQYFVSLPWWDPRGLLKVKRKVHWFTGILCPFPSVPCLSPVCTVRLARLHCESKATR